MYRMRMRVPAVFARVHRTLILCALLCVRVTELNFESRLVCALVHAYSIIIYIDNMIDKESSSVD